MSWEWAVSLLPAGLLIALAVVTRRREGSWLAPGAFFALVWATLTAVPMLMVSDEPPWPPALAWIVLSAGVVYLGSVVGIRLSERWATARPDHRSMPQWPALTWLILLLTIIGWLAIVLILHSRGKNLSVFLSLHTLTATSRDFLDARYLHGYQEPGLARIMVTSIYLGAIMGGLLLGTRPRGLLRWVGLLPLVPAAGVAAILSTRASLIFPLIFIAVSYLATRVAVTRGQEPLFTRFRIATAIAILAALFIASVAIQVARYKTPPAILPLLTAFRLDLFGYLALFSLWFRDGWHATNLTLGSYTFAGLFELIGHNRAPGLYQTVTLNHHSSNVFTIFRGLIEDFSLSGAIMVLAAFGLVAGFAYHRIRGGHFRYLPILSAFYAISLWSFVVDIFAYNTILLAWILFAMYLWVPSALGGRAAPAFSWEGPKPKKALAA